MTTKIPILMVISVLVQLASAAHQVGEIYPFSCQITYKNGEWGEPQIFNDTRGYVSLACNGIQLGQNVFDALRWFRGFDEKYRIFRPDYKYDRIAYGTQKMALPLVPKRKFYQCLAMFVKRARDNAPDPRKMQSIYMRANIFGAEDTLLITKLDETMLTLSGYIGNDEYASSLKSLRVRVERDKLKNFDGSLAYVKTATNYGPTYESFTMSQKVGCNESLWLYPAEDGRKCIAELNHGNVFMVIKDRGQSNGRTLVTLHAEYILFPGSYRNAIIQLSSSVPNLRFTEGCVDISSISRLLKKKRLLEIFTCGHYVQLTPVTAIKDGNITYDIPTMQQPGAVYLNLKNMLYDMFYGKSANTAKFMFSPRKDFDGLELSTP